MAKKKITTERVGALSVAMQAGLVAKERWERLTPEERARFQTLLLASRGRPKKNLKRTDRRELTRLTGKLDLTGFGREVMPLVKGRKGRR